MPSGTFPAIGLPSKAMLPSLACCRPAISSNSVDFPQPDGPTTAKNSPVRSSRSSGPSAWIGRPPVATGGKTRVTPRSTTSGAGASAGIGPYPGARHAIHCVSAHHSRTIWQSQSCKKPIVLEIPMSHIVKWVLAFALLLAAAAVRAEEIVVSNYGSGSPPFPWSIALEKHYFQEEGADITGIISSEGG